MINHFTNYLASTQDNVEGVLFDLSDDHFVVTVIFEDKNFSLLNWIKPTLRPGEIFLASTQRTGKVNSSDEKDFVIAVKIEFDLSVESSDFDSIYLKFQQPRVGAYYRQDLYQFRKKQLELGEIIGRYDALNAKLDRINEKLESSGSGNIERQLNFTAKKLEIRKQLNELGGRLDKLNREIARFSGSYLTVLPSDQVIQSSIRALDGEVSGDSILQEVFRRIDDMGVIHRKLDIKLLGSVNKRSGTIRVGNLSQSLIGIVPGLQIKKLSITSKSTEAHISAGLRTQNHVLSIEADIDIK